MSQQHHHSSHGHDDYGHDHHDHDGHDHSDETEPAIQTLIWQQIEFEKIRTLNEREPDAGAKIVEKTWRQRLNPEPELVSDTDEQLLMFVPFAGVIRLHSLLIRTSPAPSAPCTLRIYLNKDDLDFTAISDTVSTQTLQLSQTSEVQEIPVRRSLFTNTHCLSLLFEDNFSHGEVDETRISYLGFKGEYLNLKREPVEALYEKAANPRDHTMVQGTGNALDGSGGRHGM